MKVHVLCANGYNYKAKDGTQKQGMTLMVCAAEDQNDSDGNGNFTVGRPIDSIFIPRTSPFDANDLINFVGKDVDLKYERKLGQRFETLVDIEVLS